MTAAQMTQMAKTFERAAIQGVRIVGKGTRRDGKTVYAVSSASDATRAYLVTVMGARLVCDCQAAKHGVYCKHRAVVSRRLYDDRANRPIGIFK